MTLMQALAVGGGLTARGTQRGIEVRRRNGDGSVHTLQVKLTDVLQPEDVIYVKESLF
jgi:polysaccharide export outer membrane protein